MLRISTIEATNERRLVVEGKLIAPWTTELRITCDEARKNLEGRELVVNLKNVSVISQEGEDLVVALMNAGVKFSCSGLFTKLVFRRLVRRSGRAVEENATTNARTAQPHAVAASVEANATAGFALVRSRETSR